MLGIGLVVGGTLICIVGVTHVFVISDLAFLHTTSEHLKMQNPQLLPLIAHDRASFGGAIVTNGVAVLLMSLWGIRRGDAWIWWTLAIAGTTNLGFTLSTHLRAGYTEIGHILPVGVGAAFFVCGLALTFQYLHAKPDEA